MMKRVALILPFFGKVPKYFGFYLDGLRGKNIDVLFFSDLDLSGFDVPGNFKLIPMTLAGMEDLIREKVYASAKLPDTRKICDYRPMFARIFADWIVGYDYWGYGDCDEVYSESLNGVVEELTAADYDVISFRKCWLSGGFCLLKNCERINSLYIETDNWREMTQEPHMCFDECCGGEFFDDLESEKITPADCRGLKCDSFSALVWRTTGIKFYHDDVICESDLVGETIYVKDGVVRLDEKEVPIFHYIGAKFRRFFTYVNYPGRPAPFCVTDTGFFLHGRPTTADMVVYRWRKISALLASLRENGIGHWVSRLARIIGR